MFYSTWFTVVKYMENTDRVHHLGWNTVSIEQYVGHHAIDGVGQVSLTNQAAHGALLTAPVHADVCIHRCPAMATCKFVPVVVRWLQMLLLLTGGN